MELQESSEMLPKNKPERQTASRDGGGKCLLNKPGLFHGDENALKQGKSSGCPIM